MIQSASVDELNFLAVQLQKLDDVERLQLNAVMHSPEKFQTIGQIIDYTETRIALFIEAKDNRTLGNTT